MTKGMENASPMGCWERLRLKVSMAYIGHEDRCGSPARPSVNGDMDVVTQPPMNWFGENFFS